MDLLKNINKIIIINMLILVYFLELDDFLKKKKLFKNFLIIIKFLYNHSILKIVAIGVVFYTKKLPLFVFPKRINGKNS